MITINELYWQAGMFEGEGSIRINKPTKRNLGNLMVDVVNTEKEVLEHFHGVWGGSLKVCQQKGNRKKHYRWNCSSRMAREFLKAIWPCLVTNKYRQKTVLAIDFQDQKIMSGRPKQKYIDYQWWAYEKMKRLNWRGTQPCPSADDWRGQ